MRWAHVALCGFYLFRFLFHWMCAMRFARDTLPLDFRAAISKCLFCFRSLSYFYFQWVTSKWMVKTIVAAVRTFWWSVNTVASRLQRRNQHVWLTWHKMCLLERDSRTQLRPPCNNGLSVDARKNSWDDYWFENVQSWKFPNDLSVCVTCVLFDDR